MSLATPFDVRWPVGTLFCSLGALLVIEGLRAPDAALAHPTGVPINLVWGGVLIAFGAAMLALSFRAKRKRKRSQR